MTDEQFLDELAESVIKLTNAVNNEAETIKAISISHYNSASAYSYQLYSGKIISLCKKYNIPYRVTAMGGNWPDDYYVSFMWKGVEFYAVFNKKELDEQLKEVHTEE